MSLSWPISQPTLSIAQPALGVPRNFKNFTDIPKPKQMPELSADQQLIAYVKRIKCKNQRARICKTMNDVRQISLNFPDAEWHIYQAPDPAKKEYKIPYERSLCSG